MNGASGSWQEPVRSILGNVLASMGPRAEGEWLQEQERQGGPFLSTLSKGLLETLKTPLNEFSVGPSALMTRPQVYKRMLEEFGEKINKKELAQVLKTFPGTTTERLKDINMLDKKTMKSYGITSQPLGAYYAPQEPPVGIIAALDKTGFKGIYTDPFRQAGFKGTPSIVIRKSGKEPVQTLSHELTHEMMNRLGYAYPYSMPYSKNPHEILATIMERYPISKDISTISDHLQIKGKNVYTPQEASTWKIAVEGLLKNMEKPPKSKLSEYLIRRARERRSR